jgi:hypothetical protein
MPPSAPPHSLHTAYGRFHRRSRPRSRSPPPPRAASADWAVAAWGRHCRRTRHRRRPWVRHCRRAESARCPSRPLPPTGGETLPPPTPTPSLPPSSPPSSHWCPFIAPSPGGVRVDLHRAQRPPGALDQVISRLGLRPRILQGCPCYDFFDTLVLWFFEIGLSSGLRHFASSPINASR